MKLFFIMSYYSAFRSSIESGKWNTEGMPAVSKLFEVLQNSEVEFQVVFVLRNESDVIQSSKIVNGLKATIHFVSLEKPVVKLTILNEFLLWKRVNELFIRSSGNQIIYCDRANITIGAIYAYFTKTPVFLRLHGITSWYFDSKKWKWKIYNWTKILSFKAPFKKVLCTEDGTPGKFLMARFNNPKNCYTWLNGVDDCKKNIGLDEQKNINILFVGRLDITKGVDDFLKISAIILERHRNISITMVGDGILRHSVSEFINKTELKGRFNYHGSFPHHEINSYYQEASLYISFNELGNLSNTVLEAINCGCIPITFYPCEKTKRDYSTFQLLYNVAMFVNRENRVEETIKIISDLSDNIELLNLHKKKVQNFSLNNLSNWDQRLKNELELIRSIVDK